MSDSATITPAAALSAVVWCQAVVAAAGLVTMLFGGQAAKEAGWPVGAIVAGVAAVVAMTAAAVGVLAYARWRLTAAIADAP